MCGTAYWRGENDGGYFQTAGGSWRYCSCYVCAFRPFIHPLSFDVRHSNDAGGNLMAGLDAHTASIPGAEQTFVVAS